jgi:molybdopterin/thiamine biosynthesis adenylyltransferase
MRLGARHIAVFDPDIVDRTNLNRLHFARQADADMGARKIDILMRQVAEAGLGVQVRGYAEWIGSPVCRDALKACDVVFGCTDDHSGRNLLNRLAYFYGIPVLDMGIRMELDENGEQFQVLDGRVTALLPGTTCLHCRGLINPDRLRAESLRRNDPEGYERERAAGYLPNEGDPAPAVVTFTTETACMAVNELIQRMHGFRGADGSWNERVRQFHVTKDFDIRAGRSPRSGCRICDNNTAYWGRGDMEPFLDVAG